MIHHSLINELEVDAVKNKLVTVLVVILLIVVLIFGGILGFLYYRNTHVFVEKTPYPIRATELDLREKDISFAHFDELHSLLPDCKVTWNVPFQNGLVSSDSQSISISSLTQKDIDLLKVYFPNLKTVDASACTDYSILEALKLQMPEIDVKYTVSLGSKSFAPDTRELTLESGDYDYNTLAENLLHLPMVSSILLKKPDLTPEQINALKEAYPEIAIEWTVEILGQEYDAETTELNLSALTSDQVAQVSGKLTALTGLTSVELMDSEGKSALSKEDVKALMTAAPQAVFNYTFEFYGETLSTATEEVRIANKRIGDEGESEVRLALDLMGNCKRFVLENCSISYDILKQIRDDYRDRTKVVWRVPFGNGSTLTDVEVIRAVYDLVDDNSHNLIYCEDVRYMDIGHDEYLDYIEFAAGMPNLEVLIVSGSPIKDLAPLANCKKLRVLEASDCGYITDLTPLAQCESLEMLNICYTKVKDLSPLDELNITHLQARGRYSQLIPQEEQDRFMEVHPDCWAGFATSDQPYGVGWRYKDSEHTLDWYEEIKVAFRYPNAPNHTGWYVSK